VERPRPQTISNVIPRSAFEELREREEISSTTMTNAGRGRRQRTAKRNGAAERCEGAPPAWAPDDLPAAADVLTRKADQF